MKRGGAGINENHIPVLYQRGGFLGDALLFRQLGNVPLTERDKLFEILDRYAAIYFLEAPVFQKDIQVTAHRILGNAEFLAEFIEGDGFVLENIGLHLLHSL